MAKQVGLDGRAENESGRIREKNGSSKMGNLANEYPELKVFTKDATLTGVKNRYQLDSLDEVRRLAEQKLRGSK